MSKNRCIERIFDFSRKLEDFYRLLIKAIENFGINLRIQLTALGVSIFHLAS